RLRSWRGFYFLSRRLSVNARPSNAASATTASTRLTRPTVASTASKLAPSLATRKISTPYQRPEARARGSSVRGAESPASPANGGTTARHTGRSRLRKIPYVPWRWYCRSMCSSTRSDTSFRPIRLRQNARPYRRARPYTAAAEPTLAPQVTANTAHALTLPRPARKAPNAAAVSAGTGGKTLSSAASAAIAVQRRPGGRDSRKRSRVTPRRPQLSQLSPLLSRSTPFLHC